MDSNDIAQIQTMIENALNQREQYNQYNVSATPYHTHNGTDSPNIDLSQTVNAKTLSGTANQVTVTGGTGAVLTAVTLSTPQNIDTAATPQFARLGLGQAADSGAVMAATGQYFSTEKTDTVSSNAVTVNWNNGNVHYIALTNGANTITLTNPKAGGRYALVLLSGGTSTTVTFSPTVNFSGHTTTYTATATASRYDVITMVYDSVNSQYLGGQNLNY